MSLEKFLDMWTRKNLTVILCKDEDYSEMFTNVDYIDMGKAPIENILEFIICAFVPYLTEFKESEYLCKNLMKSEVTTFYVNSTYMIVWIKEKKDANS